MPFIGQEPQIGAYHVLDSITASATATYNLQLNGGAFSPVSANHLLVSLNGVLQKPGASFNVSGSQITFSSALTSSDNINFIMALGNVLDVGTPTDGTVNADKLAANAVTTAKIADGAVTTAKITDANVTEAKLASAVGVLTEYDIWSLTSNTDFASNDVIKTPLSRATHAMFEKIGTGMSLDSSTGYWTFPSTGFYEVGFGYTGTRTTGATSNIGIQIRTSTDSGSNWGSTLTSRDDISSTNRLTAGYGTVMLKVTNTSTHLVQFRFQTGASTGTRLNGSTTSLTTYFFFKKIKDA
tara:strand:+ start:1572 stop:2462 length:891 start_codon:yes stop_codon:yes gene_type:complete